MNVIPFRPETFLSNDQIGGEMTEKEIMIRSVNTLNVRVS